MFIKYPIYYSLYPQMHFAPYTVECAHNQAPIKALIISAQLSVGLLPTMSTTTINNNNNKLAEQNMVQLICRSEHGEVKNSKCQTKRKCWSRTFIFVIHTSKCLTKTYKTHNPGTFN